jgi:2,4-dienoyl-CoA reductase-like NADH-dependent reductase (Old Yellow Enzyme family)
VTTGTGGEPSDDQDGRSGARRGYPQVKQLSGVPQLRARLVELGEDLPLDDAVDPDGPLSRPLRLGRAGTAANRFCVLPMEGWDATTDGRPTELVRRRWQRFGLSGAGLVWGGEAVAVVPEGRANPHQLCIGPRSVEDLGELRAALVDAHVVAGHDPDGLVVGLQLTHSGRWSRPEGSPAPRVAYRHRLLDPRVGVDDDGAVLTDTELDDLIGAFVAAAEVARDAGFDFVDVKQCHGYLLHELLSGVTRPGPYGGDLEGRSRFARRTVEAISSACPELVVGSRLSLFDLVAHRADPDGLGEPEATGASVPFCFGGDGSGVGADLTETDQLIEALRASGVELLCASAGSPYYVPHVQRPAYFPPSDGYLPPRDPLVDAARLQQLTAQVAEAHPGLPVVASALTYFQDHLPNVAQALVRQRWCSAVGIGRMVLSYPELPADVLAGRSLQRRAVCRTFSDCTTAPRHGLVSGCYPLDEHYKGRPERRDLAAAKRRGRSGGAAAEADS